MKPEPRPVGVEQLLKDLCGKGRAEEIEANRCATCDKPDLNFTDGLSLKEYKISGMCQRCQDDFFNNPPEEDDF